MTRANPPPFASLCVALLALLLSSSAEAQTRRALVIGIDRYERDSQLAAGAPPPAEGEATGGGRDSWGDLSGAVNDSDVFAELLQRRFGFAEHHVLRLRNEEATLAGIRAAFARLTEETQKGDVVVFYYAGHGSQVKNSKSPEGDGLDETMVPSDSWRGSPDLRDKELAELFDGLLKKGAVFTAVMDSCHSGSIARGPLGDTAPKARTLPPDPRDVADAKPPLNVEKRGALILSAAQQDESAYEATDEYGNPRGRLSLALQRALAQAEPGESAERLFRRVRAQMGQFGSPSQQPALSGNAARKRQPLFGGVGAEGAAKAVLAVRRVEGKEVVLQGGLDQLVHPGTQLVLPGTDPQKDKEAPRVEVTRVEGLVSSHGTVVSGDPSRLQNGALLEVATWGAPATPNLRVALPSAELSPEQLMKAHEAAATAAASAGLLVVDALAESAPHLVLFFRDGQWRLSSPPARTVALGAALDPDALTKTFTAEAKRVKAKGEKTLFINLPPTGELTKALRFGPGTANSAIAVTGAAEADYVLVGRANGGALEYAWLRPSFGKSQSTLPVSSAYVPLQPQAAAVAKLEGYAQRLARVSGWLSLQAPGAGDSSGAFPYRLSLRKAGKPVAEGDRLVGGNEYVVGIERDPNASSRIARRYVYVFVIDAAGASSLVFPHPDEGDLENRFPLKDEAAKPFYELTRVEAAEPFGFDTWVMITTADKLSDPLVLESDGVRTRGNPGGDPLTALLGNVGSAARGATRPVPVQWSVEKLTLQSVPPGAAPTPAKAPPKKPTKSK